MLLTQEITKQDLKLRECVLLSRKPYRSFKEKLRLKELVEELSSNIQDENELLQELILAQ